MICWEELHFYNWGLFNPFFSRDYTPMFSFSKTHHNVVFSPSSIDPRSSNEATEFWGQSLSCAPIVPPFESLSTSFFPNAMYFSRTVAFRLFSSIWSKIQLKCAVFFLVNFEVSPNSWFEYRYLQLPYSQFNGAKTNTFHVFQYRLLVYSYYSQISFLFEIWSKYWQLLTLWNPVQQCWQRKIQIHNGE